MNETFQKITELSEIQSENLTEFKNVEEYEICLLHIEKHINAAILLYKNSYFEQAVFLIITSFEEITKAEICIYRGLNKKKTDVKRSKDGLFNHKTKHVTVANDITFRYLRSSKIFGNELVDSVMNNLKSGKFIDIRENSLYFKNLDGKCIVSDKYITEQNTRLLLMICIEVFEDRLFGISSQTDVITDRVLEKLKDI